MGHLASGCPNLTFLDVSRVQIVKSLVDVTQSCRSLKTLRARHCDLQSQGLFPALGHLLSDLEELDIFGNYKLDPLQPLSRLFPGCSPNLKILRMGSVGQDEANIQGVFVEQLYVSVI